MARHNQKVKLKRSDLEVTRLSLGTAPLGGLFKSVTDADGDELLNTALDVGINYFDTAPQYGHGVAEIRLGKALRGAKVPFVVETKVGRVLRHDPNAETFPWFPDAPRDLVPVFDYSPDGIRRAFDESLERMGLDHLDIVLMHDAEDHVKEAIENAFPVLAEYRSQGLIKAVGIGINQAKEALQIMKGTDLDIALIAGRYSLLDQISHHELFPYALAHNIDISMGGVLNSGVLANPVAGATYNYLPASDEIISRAAKIGDFLKARNISLLAAALQFPLRHPAVTSVLTGPRTAAELLENVDAFNLELPADIWAELEDANLIERIPA
ncbi:Tas Predicted oxidoreductases (related to aryl-alcohol dehydrogenases) [Candidatus Nanopelagicaceae bacterium]